MAAKTWEKDYRYRAIRASIRALGDRYRDEPYDYPGSYCLPVGEKPINGMNPGRLTLVALVLGFALMGAGAFILSRMEEERPGVHDGPMTAVAVCCMLAGVLTFLLPSLLYRRVVSIFLGERGRRLVECSHGGELLATELSDSAPSAKKITIDGDDNVLILFDEQQHRLLIEGTGARYQIRADDVSAIRPYTFANYVGAAIDYHIDDQTVLSIAIARVSLWLEIKRQLPFLFFWNKTASNPLLEKCERTLQRSEIFIDDTTP